jgi:hypothetical protein
MMKRAILLRLYAKPGIRTPASRSKTLVSAMEILRWIAEQECRNPNESREEDNAAAKINSGKLGFLHDDGRARIYKPPLMGILKIKSLDKIKAQRLNWWSEKRERRR